MIANSDPITWTDELATGVPEIDKQHRYLVATINEANARLAVVDDIELVEQITKDLLAYAIFHFDTEENLMREYAYAEASPDAAELHQKQHREFSARVIAVRDSLREGKSIPREALLSFLNGWLVDHIMNTDRLLGAHIRGKRAR